MSEYPRLIYLIPGIVVMARSAEEERQFRRYEVRAVVSACVVVLTVAALVAYLLYPGQP